MLRQLIDFDVRILTRLYVNLIRFDFEVIYYITNNNYITLGNKWTLIIMEVRK